MNESEADSSGPKDVSIVEYPKTVNLLDNNLSKQPSKFRTKN